MINKILIITLVLLTSCKQPIDIEYIKKHQWKAGSSEGWIGDWLFFSSDLYKISNDTIFKNDTAKAVIISLDKNGFVATMK